MADERLEVEVRANITGLERDMAAASSAISGVGDAATEAGTAAADQVSQMEKLKEASTEVGKAMLVAGGVIGAGVALSVVEFSKFDKALAGYRAVAQSTKTETEQLGKAAMDLGETYGYSAVSVVEAATALNKAGISTADILGGALKGALTMAATDTMDVAEAAEIASIAMTQFALKGSDVPHVADLLAAGAANAVGDVKDLAWGLRQTGLVASQFGLDLEDTIGALSGFAAAGLIGSDAGTSMKQMLLSLAAPSGVAQKKMAELGFAAYDAQENFIGIEGLAGELKRTLGHLSQEQRNAALATIFGQDAIRTSTELYNMGAEGVREWADKVDQAGFASRVAAEKLNSLNGDWNKLTVSIQNGLIEVGSHAQGFLRPLVQAATGAVQAFRDLPEPAKGAMLAVAGVTAGVLIMAGTVLTAVPKVMELKEAWGKLSGAAGPHMATIGRVAKMVGALAIAYAAAATAANLLAFAENDKKTSSTEITNRLSGVAKDPSRAPIALDDAFRGISHVKQGENADDWQRYTPVNDFKSGLQRIYKPNGFDVGNDFMGDMPFMPAAGGKKTRAAFQELDTSLSSLTSVGGAESATKTFAEMAKQAEEAGVPIEDLIKLVPNYRDAMVGLATQNGLTNISEEEKAKIMAGTSTQMQTAAQSTEYVAKQEELAKVETEKWNKALADIGVTLAGTIENVSLFTDFLAGAGLITLSARDATAQFEEALDGLGKKTGDIMKTQAALGGVLNDTATDFDLMTEPGRAANDVFAEMTTKGLAVATAMAKNGDSQEAVQQQLVNTYDAMVLTAKGFGLGEEEATALTRSVLHIPPGVAVETWMEDQARIEADNTKAALDAIPKKVEIRVNTFATTYEAIVKAKGQDAGNQFVDGSGMGDLQKKAAGGAVYGEGAKGIDSVPHLLAPGEHVLTSSEVDKMGGQAAVYAMRASIRSGAAYASNSAPAPAAVSAPVTFAPVFNVSSQDTGAVVQEVKGWMRYEAQKAGLRIGA